MLKLIIILFYAILKESETSIESDDISYYLSNKVYPNKSTEIDLKNLNLNDQIKIVFLIHGWMNNRDIEWYELFKNGFLNKTEDYYVVEVDWENVALNVYSEAAYGVYKVGNHIGDFIVTVHKTNKIPLNNFLLIGHSLGAQIAGAVGKRVTKLTNQKLPRIVALDPAGPIFTGLSEDERLNKNDAKVVHVLHTDDDLLGFPGSIGTIDFFPNGGSNQPGCVDFRGSFDVDFYGSLGEIVCDHVRAWKYFAEAIINPKAFMAKKCSSWKHFKNNICQNITIFLGDLSINQTVKVK
ncbi:unnamed protein product [Brassicogethes aeneus]|uniref:Lipase domain-containing protein n=1 Tax=Brassicogethes aeneus TaxID=1431903 RepID=A0A9P0FE96_BRAAE|nr:unnamed protein product [Brassicogethes aeneus]